MTQKIQTAISTPIMDMILKLVTILIIPWSVWITSGAFACKHFMQRGDRFTIEDGHSLEKAARDEAQKTRQLIWQFEKEFSSEFVRKEELEIILKNKAKD